MLATGTACGVAVAAVIGRAVGRVPVKEMAAIPDDFGTTGVLADKLFTAYLVPFELTSFLLLVAVVGAVALAKRKV